jgi:hypothetical protein
MQSLQQHLAMVQRRQCVAAAPKDDLDDHVDAMVKGLAGCLAADPALFAETLLGVRRDVQFAAACGLPVCLCKLTEDGVLWDGDWCDCAGVEVFDRRVQNLHFVVQNVSTDFWLTCINVDAARAPLLSRFCRPRSTVSLKLPCSDVRRLFGLGP